MSPPLTDRPETRERIGIRRAWKESHGNLILLFAVSILLVGVFLIWLNPPSEPLPASLIDGEDAEATLPPDSFLIRISSDAIDASGPIRLAIYDSEEVFGDPDKAFIKDAMTALQGFAIWRISLDELPEEFGVAAYHDLDNNGELNRGLLNAPVEPYGFSNNARSLVGPPQYTQTLVERPETSEMIEIRVR